jgi:hypothetical protein
MMAIDWGHSPEDTAARLMEVSVKAQENGEGYATTTAANAAAAVRPAEPKRQNRRQTSDRWSRSG